jgi:hypothetical protein
MFPDIRHCAGRRRSRNRVTKKGAPPGPQWSQRRPSIIRQWHQGAIYSSWDGQTAVNNNNIHLEEEDPTNLQELGMNLSGSQDKPTLALTIPRSNQVVYKGFPSATQFLSIQALRCGPLPSRNAFSTQVMIRTRPKTRLLSNPITQPTTFRRSIQRGFRLRGVQPLSHA